MNLHLRTAIHFHKELLVDIRLNLDVLRIMHEREMWHHLFLAAYYGEI